MKNLLYIGNELKARGGAPTSIDVLAPLLRAEGLQIQTASSKKNQLLRLSDMLITLIKNSHWADAVLIDTYSTRNYWYTVIISQLCRILNLDYILILHGGGLQKRLKKNPKLSRVLFSHSKLNIAPSHYLYETFQNAGFKNLIYIPNSVFLKEYHYLPRKVLKPKLLWVRAFAEIYNPHFALQVLRELLNEYPEAELCMIGPAKDQSYQHCLEYAQKYKLPVSFPGRLSKAEWIELSKKYDIFLNTTNIDNTPVSVIEAMALGLPVVSTNVGGLPYLLEEGETGLLVPPGDFLAMLNAIKNLLDSPELAEKLSQTAREQVEKFDWEVVKSNWIEMFEQL
ncbi:glycosyltransferase family 4 protein [Salegentibacter sediminis]|uniref:glycosyltransferase family 4 protein n=1 Tax=Salegentibacter sediminis TaxID=1930251 RepID=UPI0009C08E4F|nr:glycosyltransferase family 4 protein [Salegentibacter sediminis]